MKTCLILMIVGWVALMSGTCRAASQRSSSENPPNTISNLRNAHHAAPASNRNRHAVGKASAAAADHHRASEKNPVRGHARVPAANRPKQPLTDGEHSKSGSAINLHQSVLNRPSGVTKDGLIQSHNETPQRSLPGRPLGVVQTTAPSLSNVRHRGSNPAVIGGLASSDTRNTAAINGNQFGRRSGRN